MSDLPQNLVRKPSGIINVNWRYQGKLFNRSTGTKIQRDAEVILRRVQDTLWRLEQGLVPVPEGMDLGDFVYNGWQIPEQPSAVAEKPLTLQELFDIYFASLPEGYKGQNSLTTERIHRGHLCRILGTDRPVERLDSELIQSVYVVKRTSEGVKPYTIKKELKTLRLAWKSAYKFGRKVEGLPQWELRDLRFAKEKSKPPFQTYEQIQRRIERGGQTSEDEKELWESLFLRSEEIAELLEFTKEKPGNVLIAFAALTGARQAELIRSEIDDFEHDQVLIHELKRSNKPTTRTVDLHPRLKEIMTEHFADHPGGRYTFCNSDRTPLAPHQCQTLFEISVRDHKKFCHLSGFHALRHSFISVLAAAGVDQRVISLYVGHQTREQEERYRHLIPKATDRPIDKLLPPVNLSE